MAGVPVDLSPLGIPLTLPPEKWKRAVRFCLPTVSETGVLKSMTGKVLFTLKGIEELGSGTFSFVEKYKQIFPDGKESIVAVKRPRGRECDFLLEALLQWHLHRKLKDFGIEFCIPEVYTLFLHKPTGDVWFTMQAYEPFLLSQFCVKEMNTTSSAWTTFALLMLQLALVLEVIENEMGIDHRDLKVNNMLVVETPTRVSVTWKGKDRILTFPFQIVLVDFGFSCWRGTLDIKNDDGLPPLDACPKEGRDLYQVIASLWHIGSLRTMLEDGWGSWIRDRLGPDEHHLVHDLNLMYGITDSKEFRAPLCAPQRVIHDMLLALDAAGKIETSAG